MNDNIIFTSNYLGFKLQIFSDRLVFNQLGLDSETIMLNQIASFKKSMFGIKSIEIFTTAGRRITVPVWKKKEAYQALEKITYKQLA